MKYYAVIDTTVIVSSFLKVGSIPDQVVSLALDGTIIPLVNNEIINEYKNVLLRNKFGIAEEAVLSFIDNISERSYFLERTVTEETFVDQKDIVFYEITLTARDSNGAYLITGNKKHFPSISFVVTPREMLDIINNNE